MTPRTQEGKHPGGDGGARGRRDELNQSLRLVIIKVVGDSKKVEVVTLWTNEVVNEIGSGNVRSAARGNQRGEMIVDDID